MEKVILVENLVVSEQTGEVVGQLGDSCNRCIDVILNNGCHQYAYYGTTDANGNFVSYCTDTTSCNNTCFGKGENDLSCRYNRKGTSNAGYYVDTAATESTY